MIGIGIGTHRRRFAEVAAFFNLESILLDGVDEYINIDAVQTTLASTTVGTWSCWVKPVDGTPLSAQEFIAFGDADANRLLIFLNENGILRGQCNSGGAQWQLDTDSVVFSDNTWTHIAIVQDGISPVLYVDGVAVAQTFITSIDKTVWFNDMIGLDNGNIGRLLFNNGSGIQFLNANIDEILFINRALTSAQIGDIYNLGCPKDESEIANGVSYFRIDGDIVNTATDSIGSNDGTYVNVEQADIEEDVPFPC